jgi:amino acid adenylation domain-containing protein
METNSDISGVAIIGIAFRFPGANSADTFWKNLEQGIESITFFTDQDLEAQGFAPELLANPNFVKAHGILDNVELFDSAFFGFSPRDADILNPQHRIFLECASEALEAAGYAAGEGVNRVGVFAGGGTNFYLEYLRANSTMLEAVDYSQLSLGNDKDFLSTLVSYRLNLLGPSLTVQTACSTSLIAVHLACQSLLTGECDMALAGGVSIHLPQTLGYIYQEGGIFSPDGHCRAFDSNARGTVAGNGAGIVVLKRLEQALEDGDHIRAVIRGSAINNDGALKAGFTAPAIEGQARVIAEAIAMAGIKPDAISYVETHGTGTPLGDPIEIAGLTQAFRAGSRTMGYCPIGSVKTNIGHLDAAAGVAGLIKTILCLEHKQLPPSLHYKNPNPEINFENTPFYVNTHLREWRRERGRRIAGVSSFGLGGTNAHLIVEEAPEIQPVSTSRDWSLLVLSAKTKSALDQAKLNLAEYLNSRRAPNLSDVAYTLQVGRRSHEHRFTVVARGLEDALKALDLHADGFSFVDSMQALAPSVVFMFPGGGAQYPNMGLGIYDSEPAFKEQVDLCLKLLAGKVKCDIRDTLFPPPGQYEAAASRLKRPSYALPALFTIEYALAKLWMSWGIRPKAMIGHSLGEYVAACTAGVFSLEDALALVHARGRLLEAVPAGAMLSVGMSEAQLGPYLQRLEGRVSIAAINGPGNCTVSGAADSIDQLAETLRKDEVDFSYVHIDVASHSVMVEQILQPFTEFVAKLRMNPCGLPYVSNVTGTWITNPEACSPAYWGRHLRGTVRFADGLGTLCKDASPILLEVGPGQSLSALVNLQTGRLNARAALSSMRHPKSSSHDSAVLLQSLGMLWSMGAKVDWPGFYRNERHRRVGLPTYPFERKRHWVDRQNNPSRVDAPNSNPLRKADMSAWFYVPSWKRVPLPGPSRAAKSEEDVCWVVFLDRAGVGELIASRLAVSGQKVIKVAPAEEGKARPDSFCLAIYPGKTEDYEGLVREVTARGRSKIRIAHLWGLDYGEPRQELESSFEHAQYFGFYSLIFLAQALAKENRSQRVEITAVTSGIHDVTGAEQICPEKATVLAACKIIPQEYANIVCRAIDFSDLRTEYDPGLAEKLFLELVTESTSYPVLAYRGGRRWAQTFEPLTLVGEDPTTLLRERGIYLITDGLAAMELDLALYLAEAFRARLVLIGQTELPGRDMWDQCVAGDGNTNIAHRIKRLRAIEEAGGEVLVIAADVADEIQMRKAIVAAEARFGSINGVIHSALGQRGGKRITQTTPSNCEDAFKAGVFGTIALSKAFHEKNLDFCLLLSSLAGLLGGEGNASYAAASLFMESYKADHNRSNDPPLTCVNLEGWGPGDADKTVIAGGGGAGRNVAALAMDSREGCEVFRTLMSAELVGQVIVSTSGPQGFVGQGLTDHMVPSTTIYGLPLTSNGNMARARLPEAGQFKPETRAEYGPPMTQTEQVLSDIWTSILGLDRVGARDNFFDLGGHSLVAAQLTSRIRHALKIEVPVRAVFENPTLKELAAVVDEIVVAGSEAESERGTRPRETRRAPFSYLVQSTGDGAQILTIPRRQPADSAPLSFGEKRLWFLDKLDSITAAYTIPAALRLLGAFRVLTLEQTLNEIVRRHETLRTTFAVRDGEPVQIISAKARFEVSVIDLGCLSARQRDVVAEQLASQAVACTFDLATGPLFKASVVRLAPEEHSLMIAMHHIISDGWSTGVLVSELSSIYNAYSEAVRSTLPELSIQYADFAIWQRERLQGAVLDEHLSFWKNLLEGAPELIGLATDRPRGPVASFQGSTAPLELPEEIAQGLKGVCHESGATLFMGLLAAFQTLLYRYTGNPDVVVGSPMANRNYQEIEPLIGFFVNTLTFRADLSDDPSFSSLLGKVKASALEVHAHQELPFERIVEELSPDRNMSYNPLFQVSMALQSAPMGELNLGGAVVRGQAFERSYTRFDLEFHLWDRPDRIRGFVSYSTDLFDGSTVQRMARHFQNIVRASVADPSITVSGIQLLGAAETHQIVSEWNAAFSRYPIDRCIHQLVEERADLRPDAAAVYSDGSVVTYGELNGLANQLAHRLRAGGVGPESVIAVVMRRSINWVVAILAALKAGGGYTCFDLSNPRDRLRAMLRDCGAHALLTETVAGFNAEGPMPVAISLDEDWDAVGCYSNENLRNPADAENLAYVVYTSGSTGKPKGVATTHGALLNLVYWHRDRWKIEYGDRGSQVAQSGFDAAVWEIWPYLTAGASVSIVDEESRLSPESLIDWLVEREITICFLPPVLAEALLLLPDLDRLKLRILFCGADKLLIRPPSSATFDYINVYGPTEAAVVITAGVVGSEGGPPSAGGAPDIGRPLPNDQVYVLDQSLGPNPIGAPGQMWIAGESLARGYVGLQELTADKFSPDPFGVPGSRMYKTGDLARLQADGKIDFIGRIDHQVKVRGFRIELGEIESALLESNLVREAVVIGADDASSNKQLIAYVVPAMESAATGGLHRLEENYVTRWQVLYDETYSGSEARDLEFDITGWNSSYTGEPIPSQEMRDWRDSAAAAIAEGRLGRVLEIGIGTGLLLYELARESKEYWGTDFSAVSIGRIRRHIDENTDALSNVRLLERNAEDFEGIPAEYFDAVIVNSVVQYFPGWEYLERVLAGAVKSTKPGGIVFVGDVRNLDLLEALHASVEIHNSPGELSVEEVGRRIRRRVEREEELLVSPEFFIGLKERQPGIGAVEIRLKRGHAHNELTKYRYDVLLHVGGPAEPISIEVALDWQDKCLGLEQVWELLERDKPLDAMIRNVPNGRIAKDLRAAEAIKMPGAAATVGEIQELCEASGEGIDPESISTIDGVYEGRLLWPSSNKGGCFDVLFTRKVADLVETNVLGRSNRRAAPWSPATVDGMIGVREAGLCTNRPVRRDVEVELVPKLKRYLGERLPEYMAPAGFVLMERLPRNTNGKVDRKSLPALVDLRRDGDETYIRPRTPEEEILTSLWCQLLGVEQVGVEDNFFDLGGHSLLATQVVSAIRDTFKVELPLAELFRGPTIAELAVKITTDRLFGDAAVPQIRPAVRGNRAPLSYAEQRLWFLDKLDLSPAAYIVPAALSLIGEFRALTLQQTLNEIIRRHETLRTTFGMEDGEPVQIISARPNCELPVIDLSSLQKAERDVLAEQVATEAVGRAFNLASGPLLRVMLVRLASEQHLLMMAMHHIISDGWSTGVLVRELSSIYSTYSKAAPSPLPELSIQYADFAIWQRQRLQGPVLDEQISFWKRLLEGAPALIELATDRPRPPTPSFQGSSVPLELAKDVGQALRRSCRKSGATLFMGLLAAFEMLLYRYTGNPDVVVGSPIANRNYREIEPLIGFFVNSLTFRGDLSGDLTFSNLLAEVKESTLEAYAHQELPFERIVEELRPARDISYNPLFQVTLALQSAPVGALTLGDAVVAAQGFASSSTRFDLEVHLWDQQDRISGFVVYNTDLFDRSTIQRMSSHFQNITRVCVTDPFITLSAVELLSPAESHHVISEWNAACLSYPVDTCIHQLVEEQANGRPDAAAVYSDGNTLSYGEMNRRANQLAHRLQVDGVGPESVVAVVMRRSTDCIVAILGILKSGGAYAFFDLSNPAGRIGTMVRDCGASVLVTQTRVGIDVLPPAATVVIIDGAWDSIGCYSGENLKDIADVKNVAYLVYTSGSTGVPKGVTVTHENVVNSTRARFSYYRDPVTCFLLVSSFAFDSSVAGMFWTLCHGGALVIPNQEASGDPRQLAQLIFDDHVSHLLSVPSLYSAILEDSGRQTLTSLQVAIVAGESCPANLIDRHLEILPATQLFNEYGPTEATVWTSVFDFASYKRREPVYIGRAITGAQITLLDSYLTPVPIGVAGEIYIGGRNVARGYLHSPDLTAGRFCPDPFSGSGGRIYRTGDLARSRADGTIDFISRIDRQLKIRGFRIELGEIEAALLESDLVREAVVIGLQSSNSNGRLVAYVVPGLYADGPMTDDLAGELVPKLKRYLGERMPEYMVPTGFVVLEQLPRNTNGKVNSKRLPPLLEPMRDGDQTYVRPRTPEQEILATIWCRLLGLDRVGIEDNFFDLGGHSLLATQVVNAIRDTFKVELPLAEFFRSATITDLAPKITTGRLDWEALPEIRPAIRGDWAPLSFAEQRLWFLDKLDSSTAAYVIPAALRLSGEFRALTLDQTIKEIIRRHETLRTRFGMKDSQPAQIISAQTNFELPLIDLTCLPEEERNLVAEQLATHAVARTFDLATGPLLRASLVRLAPEEHLLIVAMHHIISDGWSTGVLVSELSSIYNAYLEAGQSTLPELSIQYADFAIWQRQRLQGAVLQEHLSFWKNLLEGAPELIELATDRPRPPISSFRGSTVPLYLPEEVGQALGSLCRGSGATLFMGLLAAFQTLLFRYTGNPDVVMGSPIANRNYQQIEPLIGFFVNSLTFREDLSEDPSFSSLLGKVKASTLEAYAHQELPFERVVEEMSPDRNIGYNPLFQVSLAHQTAPMGELHLGGAAVRGQSFQMPYTRFDLEFHVWDYADRIRGFVVYSTDLFDHSTIQRMAAHFRAIVRGACADPFMSVSRIEFLSPVESHQIISEWNAACLRYPSDRLIHHLVDQQGNVRPDAAAVYADGDVLSYGEMNRRANQLAHWLRVDGVGPESIVAVVMRRSIDWIVAMLGILKAGAAYACFDLSNPIGRIRTMIKDCGARVLVTHAGTGIDAEPSVTTVLIIGEVWESGGHYGDEDLRDLAHEKNPSYVVYTSGSTGKPKGVVTSHGALLNLVYWHRDRWKIVVEDKGSQVAQSGFDAAVWEIWPYLSAGASISIADKHSRLSADKLCDWLIENEITIGWLPPVLAEPLLQLHDLAHLKMRILFAGADRLLMRPPSSARFEYINIYGPTEAAAITTTGLVASEGDEAGAPDIGRPVHNDQVYILDRRFGPNPIGAPGQLCIGGKGLARGYLGAQELTAEKFCPDPFCEPGGRMYKTGDLVRLRPDGKIDFIARIDHQVKIRGFRIELGEIESALLASNLVGEVVVIGSQGPASNKQLIAYVAPATESAATGGLQHLEENYIGRWQVLYDETYAGSQAVDPRFDITGWNSSYTGAPIPAQEMREWRDSVVAVIQEGNPVRVLEIGTGTGLLLYKLASRCQEYWGTDFSAVSIGRLRRQIEDDNGTFWNVRLLERSAEDFEGIPAEHFDAVVINSVVQYFPGWEYLERVLAGAVKSTRPGGIVFVGDVRNLDLLEALRSSVEIHNSPDAMSTEEVGNRIRRRVEREEELLVSPQFFHSLRDRQSPITAVEIRLKRGRAHNELTKYRYDVLLHIGRRLDPVSPEAEVDWQNDDLSLEHLWDLLERDKPSAVVITNIPNGRLAKDLKALEAVKSTQRPATVAGIKEMYAASGETIDPESICTIHHEYQGTLFWSSSNGGAVLDILFTRREAELSDTNGGVRSGRRVLVGHTLSGDRSGEREAGTREPVVSELPSFTNRPMREELEGQLVPKLKAYLAQRLPEYMTPSRFVIMDRLPRNSNGKVDRKSLPPPLEARRDADETYVRPITPEHEILASLWARLLGLDRVGIEDNFFDLGGHSLLATQVVSAIRDTFKVELPLAELFRAATIAELATKITVGKLSGQPLQQIKPAVRAERAPLSWAQQRLWFLDQLDSTSTAYNVVAALRAAGYLRDDALGQTLREIARRHEALRTTFALDSGQPVQVISLGSNIELNMVDLSDLDSDPVELLIKELLRRAAILPFDLSVGPLFRPTLLRIGPEEHVIIVTMHHIISDGWSMGLLVDEISQLHQAWSNGCASPLKELPIQYADFAIWQREWLSGEILQEHISFWRNQLRGAPDVTNLPFDRQRTSTAGFRGGVLPISLGHQTGQGLRRVCRDNGATLFMGLVASLQVLLSRYTGHPDVVVGSPIANRNHGEIEGLIGFFVNMLVLRADLSHDPSWRDFLSTVKNTALGAYAHQDLPFERIVEEMQPERAIAHNPLFQVSIALQNAPMGELDLGGLVLKPQPLEAATTRFDIEFLFWEYSDSIRGLVTYGADVFDETTIRRLTSHFEAAVLAMTHSPSIRVSEVALLGESELHQVVTEWNGTAVRKPVDQFTHQMVEARAGEVPDAVALISDEEHLSYRVLNQRANQLACYLRTLGVRAESIVGILMERGIEWVLAQLAVLKAGAAYASFDTAYPPDRIRYMLRDSKATVALTLGAKIGMQGLSISAVDILSQAMEIDCHDGNDLSSAADEDNLAYVFYTSGSTGQPKGVAVSNRSLLNLVSWYRRAYAVASNDRASQIALAGFDATVWEIWPYLASGASICILDDETRISPPDLFEKLVAEDITIGWLPPILSEAFLPRPDINRLKFRSLSCGGDRVVRRPGDSTIFSYVNVYGPTEFTAIATAGEISRQGTSTSLPDIGRPLDNSKTYIISQGFNPEPIRVAGQLCLAGVNLGRGYIGRPDLTADSFVPNPLGEPGHRMYKTGDLARLRSDGKIEFLGRLDHQVKIRGFRIELGEIEAAFSGYPGIRESVVAVRENARKEHILVAYVVTSEQQGIERGQLRGYLKRRLPEFMVPAVFIEIAELPLTPNRKVDRRALPPPEPTEAPRGNYEPPRTHIEQILAEIWRQVLGKERIGTTDDFFEIGGHSLIATQIVNRIKARLEVEIRLLDLFGSPTISKLASIIERARSMDKKSPMLESSSPSNPDTAGSAREPRFIALQRNRASVPVFFVHGGGGGVTEFIQFSRSLGSGQSFFAIRALVEDDPESDVEQIAARYVDALLREQEHGPFQLGGWSFGAMVAFEMAQQLCARNEVVQFLALVDMAAPIPETSSAFFRDASRSNLLAKLGRDYSGWTVNLDPREIDALEAEEQVKYLLDNLQAAGVLPSGIPHGEILAWFKGFVGRYMAITRYVGRPYDGPVTLFRAKQFPKLGSKDPLAKLGDAWGWDRLSSEPVHIHWVDGDHYSIWESPGIQHLADIVKTYLAAPITST